MHTKPLRLVFLTPEYPPLPSGGIGVFVRALARLLAAQGHAVTVVGWKDGGACSWEDAGVRVRFLSASRLPGCGWLLNRWRAQQFIRRLAVSEGVDLVEAPDWCGPSAGMHLPCPVVIRCHGSATYFGHLLHERVRIRVQLTERLALRQAARVAAVSRFCADTTATLFGRPKVAPASVTPHSLPPDTIRVIYNGVDTTRFQAARETDVEPGVILSFGTLVRKKGALDLPAIFNRVVASCPQARLRIIGRDNPDRGTGAASIWQQMQAAFSCEARQRVEYLGPLPHEALQEQIRGAAVCVFPSSAEAFPLTWLEAMACGKAIAGYDLPWAREAVGADAGRLAPVGDTAALADILLGLLANQEVCAKLGVQARQRVEACFSQEHMLAETLRWYAEVLGNKYPARGWRTG